MERREWIHTKEPNDVTERGWVSIENAMEISRAPEDVFDYLTDITREFEWNPRTRRAEKLTSGPIGLGTRFGAEWIKLNPTIIEYVTFGVRRSGDPSLVPDALMRWLRDGSRPRPTAPAS